MSRKRLQNVTDNLCQMFVGWRLNTSKPRIVECGSGTLEIDVLTGRPTFQDEPIVGLPIAQELFTWLTKELSAQQIPVDAILRARLTATLLFTEVPWNTKTKETFLSEGKIVRSEKMHQCAFDCDSEVATEEAIYHSQLREVQEWPLGWPETFSKP